MSVSSFDLLPTFQEKRDFRLPTHQRCETSWLSHIQSAIDPTFAEDAIYSDRLSNPSECLYSQILALEIALD
jgi:hypothetical protein